MLKDGSVFLHIPKTGGSWVRHVLEELDLVRCPLGKEHITFERLFWYDRFHRDGKELRNWLRRNLGLLPRVCPNSYKFCFVREPLGWYVSWWRFMQGKKWKSWNDEVDPYQWHPVSMLNKLGSPDFNTFVHNVNQKRPGFVTELYGWYVRPGVNFIGKQERIVQDLAAIFKHLNVPMTEEQLRAMPRVNESKSDFPVPEWDPALKRETYKLEYPGYIRFGYPDPFAPKEEAATTAATR